MEKVLANGQVHECCKVTENLEAEASAKPELTIKRCRVCGRRHYRLMAEPGIFGMTFKPGIRGG